jgi:serine/threonine protein kinase
MARYCDGAVPAFRALYAAAAPRLVAYLRCFLHDRAAADDFLQEAFIELHGVRATHVHGADPVSGLYAIAHRTCLAELRRWRRARMRLVRPKDRDPPESRNVDRLEPQNDDGPFRMPDADLPALIGGRYRVLRLLGKGGMGAVYEVEHTRTGQHLALKLLTQHSGASAERFKREARATSGIRSDHIVRVTDADTAAELGGAPFLVMDLLEGADLARVTGDRPSAPADVIEWLRQVARGLDKAHARGVVHRDLKPENLFLTQREDGSPLVKIVDFGIAKVAAEPTLTQSDAFLGTPGFMAPEQTDSRGSPVTLRADLYALGLIAFKLLTGHSYFRACSPAQIVAQILIDPMPPPSERGSALGPVFDAWFSRACDRDASKRFASAGEQVEALAAALGLAQRTRVSSSGSGSPPSTVANPSSTTLRVAPTLDLASSDVNPPDGQAPLAS